MNQSNARHSQSAVAIGLLLLALSGPGLALVGVGEAPITGHHASMLEQDSLRESVARDGFDDVVAIGSSITLFGVDPMALSSALGDRLEARRAPRAFTFGMPGHNVLTYPLLVELVLAVDRPQVLVLLVAPRSIDASAEAVVASAQTVLDSPYARAIDDPLRLRGRIHRMLLDHSALARRAGTVRGWLSGEIESWRPEPYPVGERGHLSVRLRAIDDEMLRAQRQIVRSWHTTSEYAAALDRAVGRAHEAGCEILIADAPRRRRLVSLMRDPSVNIGNTHRFMNEARERLGVAVAFVPDGLVSDSDFGDLTHLLPAGAERYSHWLAEQIANHYPDLRL
jgi:hypothetical protein